jgi:hypothetical protein
MKAVCTTAENRAYQKSFQHSFSDLVSDIVYDSAFCASLAKSRAVALDSFGIAVENLIRTDCVKTRRGRIGGYCCKGAHMVLQAT